ncbi:NAD(P)H-dependent flavin oxidoreductase [Rhodovulum sp. DZ06]|uniref:NAD(P)H-dependent flavin oxidoreductase n=1 Tax=Rhodovulum sp. DZ06 TaxID=3425126 RepID=UPI003D3273F9
MPLPAAFARLRLPLIGAPMLIVSGPELVIAQCKAGIVGAFPALNAREKDGQSLDAWLARIEEELDRHNQANPDRPAAPYAVNHIVHKSNARLERDLEICERRRVPVWITSLGARPEVNAAAHACGGLALHDVASDLHARKAVERGADGLIALAAGAGGHGGTRAPFAMVQEIRAWFDGPLFLAGAIGTGDALLAALAMGADGGYAGSAFIAAEEANADPRYKRMVVEGAAKDILWTGHFAGVPANYLRPAIAAAGLDPDALGPGQGVTSFAEDREADRPKAWKDIWSAGHGIGATRAITPAAETVARLEAEFAAARARLSAQLAALSAD